VCDSVPGTRVLGRVGRGVVVEYFKKFALYEILLTTPVWHYENLALSTLPGPCVGSCTKPLWKFRPAFLLFLLRGGQNGKTFSWQRWLKVFWSWWRIVSLYWLPFNNRPDALIIQIYSVIKLYMFRASSLPIIRSSVLYIRHWDFHAGFDDRFQAESRWIHPNSARKRSSKPEWKLPIIKRKSVPMHDIMNISSVLAFC
jgi:hypothetical protein